jgi:hypothetical protein
MRPLLVVVATTLTVLSALALQDVVSLDSSPSDSYKHQPNKQENRTAAWPSLRLFFTLKRNSMEVHGTSAFSMVADPVLSDDGSHVLYNAFSTFKDGEVVHNYTLLDGAAYYSSSGVSNSSHPLTLSCLETELDHLPPINRIVEAISQATVGSTTSAGVECSNDKLFQVTVNDVDFALCALGSGLKMYGSDMDISVEYLAMRVNISTATISGSAQPDCAAVEAASKVTSTGRSLLTGDSISWGNTRRLEAELDFSWGEGSSCTCKSTPRPCIFIHGMGIPIEEEENVDSLSRYWGNLTGHAPCCSTMKYTVLDTVNSTWTDDSLQQKVCDRALAVSKTSTGPAIMDTIVVTHSMGNLMLASAIASSKCSLDSSATWVGLAGPMKGSKASDFIQESCAGNTNFILEGMVENSGRCPPTTSLKSLPYQGEEYSTPELDAAYTAAQKVYQTHVSALMCSESFSGLRSSKQPSLWALGTLGHHHSFKNDGMVEFQSCAVGIPESKFGKTWRDRFYRTKLNHYDMQFKYGDALFSKAKMPVKWFECLL